MWRRILLAAVLVTASGAFLVAPHAAIAALAQITSVTVTGYGLDQGVCISGFTVTYSGDGTGDQVEYHYLPAGSGGILNFLGPSPYSFSAGAQPSFVPSVTGYYTVALESGGQVLSSVTTPPFTLDADGCLPSGSVSTWPPDLSDEDLALTGIRGDITTNATSPGGAAVAYRPPTLVDEDSPATASVGCSPESGSTFAIGTTTVTCTATDSDDTNGPVTTSFKIMVKGAAEQLADVYSAVQGVGPGTSLADKVAAMGLSVASGKTPDACEGLRGFINEVSAQSGKLIPATQAGRLAADAQRIQSVLGCSK